MGKVNESLIEEVKNTSIKDAFEIYSKFSKELFVKWKIGYGGC